MPRWRLAALGPPQDSAVAIETRCGLVVDRLLEAGFAVVPIHPNSFDAARPRWGASRAKSDPGDSWKLADYVRTDGHRRQRLDRVDLEWGTFFAVWGLIIRRNLIMGSGMTCTPEFRAEAVRGVLDSSRPVREIAESLGIRPDALRGWIQRTRKEAIVAEERDESEVETEIRELKKQLRDAEDENRFLEKAAAFFASEQRPQNGMR